MEEIVLEKKLAIGELNEEDLKALVAKYPKCNAAIFENGSGEKVCVYLKKVEREVFVAGNKILNSKDELTTCEYLLKNLWVEGCDVETIFKDFDALKNCSATILQVLWVKAGELKKN